jgi:hypothetical protein
MEVYASISGCYLRWLFTQLGLKYSILLPVSGVLCFVLVLAIVLRSKGPMAAVALVLVVHVPLLIGLYATIEGIIETCTVIHGVAPSSAELASGIGTSLAAAKVAILLMVPAYSAAAIGAFLRGRHNN